MICGIWNRDTVALIFVASALPVAIAWLSAEGLSGVWRLGFSIVLGGLWQTLFTVLRAQPPSAAGFVSALLVAMLAPDVGPMQFVLGVSFGFVFGELVFGGWGRSVLSPAVVAVTFLGFAFPAAGWPHLPVQVGWAAVPAALLLLAFGVMPWRMLAGALVVLLAAGGGVGLLSSAVALVLVLLVCDPAVAPSTPLGRWLAGLLYGALVALFADVWAASAVQMAVSAAFLVSLSGPLLDEIALSIWQFLRRYRNG